MSHHDEVTQFFDKTENYLDNNYGVRIRAHIVRRLAGHLKSKNILDLGCGNGMVTIELGTSNKMHLVDISMPMLKLAEENYARYVPRANVTFYNRGLNQVRINEKVDLVVAFGLLAHLENIPQTLDQMNRVSDDSAHAIIQFSPCENIINKYRINKANRRIGYGINKINSSWLKQLVEEHGFEIEEEISYGFMIPGLGVLPNDVLYKLNKLSLRNSFLKRIHTERVWYLRKVDR